MKMNIQKQKDSGNQKKEEKEEEEFYSVSGKAAHWGIAEKTLNSFLVLWRGESGLHT